MKITFRESNQCHLDMDVRRPSLIPPGKDRGKRHITAAVRRLNSAEEVLGRLRAVLRIIARRIDMPDFDVGVGETGAQPAFVFTTLMARFSSCSRFAVADVASELTCVSDGNGPAVSAGVTAQAAFVEPPAAAWLVVEGAAGELPHPSAIAARGAHHFNRFPSADCFCIHDSWFSVRRSARARSFRL